MAGLLLAPDVVVELCATRSPAAAGIERALNRCVADGHSVWLYVGMVATILGRLKTAFETQRGLSRDAATAEARRQLAQLAKRTQWLAALAGEGDVLDDADPETAQLVRALDRFDGKARLLTNDESILSLYPGRAIDPASYVAKPDAARALPFADLETQQAAIRARLETNLHRVLLHGHYIMGPEVARLEKRLADYVGVRHCVTVASGTDALLVALMASGIGPGDEVITTPFSFFATVEAILLAGAIPVFVDIDPLTYNMDPARLAAAITPKTRAILPVSLYGQCADFDAINAVAARHRLPVIEDAAQSFGATYQGRRSCSLTTIGATSFFPSKPLGCYGDGGALFTDDDSLAQTMREIRVHGQTRRYHHARIGLNGRLDTLQAAVLLAKLDRFDEELANRSETARLYSREISARCPAVGLPYIAPGNTSVYAQYTIRVGDRPRVIQSLSGAGIPTAVHYPLALHRQPAVAGRHHAASELPAAEEAAEKVVSLPMGPDLPPPAIARIVGALAPCVVISPG